MADTVLESNLFRSYWDDGLVDLLIGSGVLVTGLAWDGPLGPLAVVQAPLWIVLWRPLRRRIVEPRAGYVRFSASRRARTARGLSWTLAAGIGALVLLVGIVVFGGAARTGVAAAQLVQGLPAAIVALGFAICGLLTGARRFHAYALGLLAVAAATVVLDRGPAAPLAVMGLVLVAAGVTLLARFVRASRDYEEAPRS